MTDFRMVGRRMQSGTELLYLKVTFSIVSRFQWPYSFGFCLIHLNIASLASHLVLELLIKQ